MLSGDAGEFAGTDAVGTQIGEDGAGAGPDVVEALLGERGEQLTLNGEEDLGGEHAEIRFRGLVPGQRPSRLGGRPPLCCVTSDFRCPPDGPGHRRPDPGAPPRRCLHPGGPRYSFELSLKLTIKSSDQ